MKADVVTNVKAKQALHDSRQRIYSMALIHEQLYGNDRLDRIDFAEYAAFKLQYNHLFQSSQLPGNGLNAQVAFTF